MAEISAAAVKALRERTGLPMMDCKRALEEAGGDPDAAVEVLRKAGKKTMEKRTGREKWPPAGLPSMPSRALVSVPSSSCFARAHLWRPTRISSLWLTTWLGSWPWGRAPTRPTRCSISRRRARPERRCGSSSRI